MNLSRFRLHFELGLGARLQRGLVLAALVGALAPSVAWAGPPPGIDPAKMSGMPRVDPNIPPGVVTVRCLLGGFANPAIGVEVELEITTAAGLVTRKATTVEQGRARFEGLAEFTGSSVVAKTTLAGQAMSSQAFVIGAQAGVALMLVAPDSGAGSGAGAGASAGVGQGTGPHGAQAGDGHGGQGEIPLPGKPFALEGRPRGTLVVGTLDFGRDAAGETTGGGLGPIADITITLTATAPGVVEPIVKTATTDAQGRAVFEELDTALPEGSAIVVEGVLAEGEDPTRSESFTLGETAYALILSRGDFSMGGDAEPTPPPPPPEGQPTQRLQLPGPRADRSLKPGQVRVFVIDAFDRPVAGELVILNSSEAGGSSDNLTGRTDAQGMVIIDGVPSGSEMLSQARVIHEGAPYASTLFDMPDDAGALVLLRVFKPTGDRNKVRSALQIDVTPRENDYASVSFNYAVFVEGDEAFWVPGGLRMSGPEGTRSFQVFPDSAAWLVHDGEAPWATLDRPLEPGIELRLSFAVGIQHDGSLELDWSTPFPLVNEASVVVVPEELRVSSGVAGAPEINPHAGPGGDPIKIYKLGHENYAPGLCDVIAEHGYACPIEHWGANDVAIVIEDLPIRSRVWWTVAWSLFGLTAFGVIGGVALRRRVAPREALLLRRDALIAELVALDERGVDSPEVRVSRARMLRALDRIYRQLEAI